MVIVAHARSYTFAWRSRHRSHSVHYPMQYARQGEAGLLTPGFISDPGTSSLLHSMARLQLHRPRLSLIVIHACLIPILFQSHPTLSDPLYQICGTTGNYTSNSTYQSNLVNLLLPALSSNASLLGFYNTTVGSVPDQLQGLVLCRGDTTAAECRACLDIAAKDIIQSCPYNKAATIWYDQCLLRFSNQYFLSSVDNSPLLMMWNTQNITEPDKFNKLVAELMDRVSRYAAYNSSRRFATGEADFTSAFPKVYGLAQCTVDLSEEQCYGCLNATMKSLPRFAGKQGGRVLGVRCNMRYEIYSFYQGKSMLLVASPKSNGTSKQPTAVPPSPALEPREGGNKKNVVSVALAAGIPLVIAFLVISIICICFWRMRLSKKRPYDANAEEITSAESIMFDLSALRAATSSFSDENKLGEGGFGRVYKGTLNDGTEIAVKRLSTSSGQGIEELKNELVLVAKLQHRNLVRLLGVCLEEQEKLLVYEYVPNRSMDTILFDPIKRAQLFWERRYKIIEGIARGLLYLHEDSQLKIIHRDLKASNVLLDEHMNPKISDFGLARLFGGDQTQGTTSRVVGTYGYMAPEYAMRGQFSVKSDVFSFGVLVLEIVTGRKNSNFFDAENAEDLLSYTWEHWANGRIFEILDSSLGENFPRSEALRCIQIGLLCVQEDPAIRPTMSMVVLMLNGYSVSLQAPSQPAFCVGVSGMTSDVHPKGYYTYTGTSEQSSAKSMPMTPNEVSISEIEPR